MIKFNKLGCNNINQYEKTYTYRPEMYLLGETSSQIGHELDDRARAELVEEYFSRYVT